ncbi:hypothetical protein Ahy_B04g072923 [Arachis hypogaea]|uniref:Protein FAR1-RELATED SEQUENCE n=1 Tax=Arachis hypogaea TaxID=3818 RepID=A0A444ZP25_ARAHY|nr:hypothetical protein Ahy_B04g072923 [Arachis hypogaea]
MSEADIMQMMNMLKSGISTSQIFCLLASQACGYECVGYGPRDMYNEIAWQRRQVPGDAARALKKLEDMRLKDPPLYFKAYYEIPVFKRKWVQLIEEFGLEDNPWVNNMYEEKHIWATAYIREHFQRCVAHLRFKEFNADYESTRGAPVIQTCIELLERFAAETKKVKSAFNDASGFTRDAVVISRQSALMEFSKQLASIAAKVPERFEETRDIIMGLYSSYKVANEGTTQP